LNRPRVSSWYIYIYIYIYIFSNKFALTNDILSNKQQLLR
jgi:hypothetical protein